MKAKTIVRLKVYYDRGKSYWSSLAVIISMITMLGVFKDSPIFSWFFTRPILYSILLAVVIVVGFVIVGFLDKKLKVRSHEQEELQSTNPYIVEMHKDIKELKDKLL